MNEDFLKKDQLIDLKIADVGMNGEGIAEYNGYTVFVPFALSGEKITARVTFVKKGLAWAEAIKILSPSERRIPAVCPYFDKCGGCDLMHADFGFELEIKRNNLIRTLKKNAGIDIPVEPTVFGKNELTYRNKIQLPFGIVKGKIVLGFFEERSHRLVPIEKCALHGEWAEKLISAVCAYANNCGLTVYDERSARGLLRHIVARNLDGRLSIVAVINGEKLPMLNSLISGLSQAFSDFSLFVNVNTKNTNVILGDKTVCVYGAETTPVNVLGLTAKLNPMSFLQVNDEVRDLLYTAVTDWIMPDKNTVVIDAYAGIGILGALFAKRGAQVYNIEIVKEAVDDARTFAKENSLDNLIQSVCGDAKFELPKVAARALKNYYKTLPAHRMHLTCNAFSAIKSGKKKYEIRLNDDKRKRLSVGDSIVFTNLSDGEEMAVRVTELKVFDTFSQMLDNLDLSLATTDEAIGKAEFVERMYTIYTPQEESASQMSDNPDRNLATSNEVITKAQFVESTHTYCAPQEESASQISDNIDLSLATKNEAIGKAQFVEKMYNVYTPQEESAHKTLAIGIEPFAPRLVLLLDPPRKGCDPEVLDTILSAAQIHPMELVYISCNPATLSRDLALLSPSFLPTRITPFNMFPRTHHLETLVCLTRKP